MGTTEHSDGMRAGPHAKGRSATAVSAVPMQSRRWTLSGVINVDSALWTDDLVVAGVGREYGVVRRVWTIGVMEHYRARGSLPAQVADDTKCDLLAFGSEHVLLTIDAFVRAGVRARWDSSSFPLNGICRWFADRALRPVVVLNVMVEVLQALHRQDRLSHEEDAVIEAVSRSVCSRPDRHEVVIPFLQGIADVFPFEILHQERVSRILTRWMARAAR